MDIAQETRIVSEKIAQRMQELEDKEKAIAEVEEKMFQCISAAPKKIVLDVGMLCSFRGKCT